MWPLVKVRVRSSCPLSMSTKFSKVSLLYLPALSIRAQARYSHVFGKGFRLPREARERF